MLGSGGVRITRLADLKGIPMHKLTERTYVNADSTKVVPEGSSEAALLLGSAGDEISDETAARLGLVVLPSTYSESTVAELRELAAERGLEIPSKSTKADIVDLLDESDRAVGAAGTAGTAQVGSPDQA